MKENAGLKTKKQIENNNYYSSQPGIVGKFYCYTLIGLVFNLFTSNSSDFLLVFSRSRILILLNDCFF